MIPRPRGAITHSPNTKLPGEDAKDATTDWETRPNLEAKPFRKDLEDTPTRSWGNRPNPKKDLTGIEIQGRCHN